jgi:hypothetical protein
MPAIGPPPSEELFFVAVEPEEDPSLLLPPELDPDVEDDVDDDVVPLCDATVVDMDDKDCDPDVVFATEVDCEPEDVEDAADGEVVVEAPGPALAA